MDLLVPRRIAEEEEADRINAAVDRQIGEARALQDDLRRIDPTLSLVLASEHSDELDHPGCWHIRKRIAGGIDEYWPLVGPEGEYREPGSWVLYALEAADLWNDRVHRDRKEAKEKLRAARARRRKLEAEQRIDEGALAGRAAKRVAGPGGMTKRAWGRR